MSKIMELVVAHETLVNLSDPRGILANRAALQAEVERMEAEREQLAKERQGFKDVAEHLPRMEAAHQQELAQVKADLKSCQAKNRELRGLAAENVKLKSALNEWIEKTDWVQKTTTSMELGLHRADVLRQRLAFRSSTGEKND